MIPKTFLIDFHGVLTDGRQSISHNGEYLFDHVHTRDVRAIRELVASGCAVVIVTASSSDIVKSFAEKVGAEIHVTRDKSNLPFGEYYAIGDDAWDVSMLQKAARAFCPRDADESVRLLPGITWLSTDGGKGVIAEVVRVLSGKC